MTYLMNQEKNSLSGASEMLRSAIGSDEAWEYLIPLLFLKNLAEESEDQIEKNAFRDLCSKEFDPDLGAHINSTLKNIEERNEDALHGVFNGFDYQSNRLGQKRDRELLLNGLIHQLEKLHYDGKQKLFTSKLELTNHFSEILEDFARRKQGAEFITPNSIAELIAFILEPKGHETVYDPTFGSGGLLSACYRYVQNKEKTACSLAGQEKNWLAWSIGKMNLYLQGADTSKLYLGDTIRSPKVLNSSGGLAQFDVVVSNHPWGLKDWGSEDADCDKFGRFKFGVPPRSNGEYAFILHILSSMKEKTGRAAAVVSNGALSRGGAEKAIRQRLIEANIIDAIISLPPKVFYNKDTAASLLILKSDRKDRSILFISAEKFFSTTRDRNLLSQDGALKISEKFHRRQNEATLSEIIELDEIVKNDYDLHVGIYVHPKISVDKIDLFALEQERIKVESELRSVEHELATLLKKLGEKYGG